MSEDTKSILLFFSVLSGIVVLVILSSYMCGRSAERKEAIKAGVAEWRLVDPSTGVLEFVYNKKEAE